MAATRRFCVQGMKTEYAFFRHLEAVKFWKLEAVKGENGAETHSLSLYSKEQNTPLLVFFAAPLSTK
jgi:heat shock protein HslJ